MLSIHAVYAKWSARGAQFLTPPKQHETELRCYIRDPDGYLIEVHNDAAQRLASTVVIVGVAAAGRSA